MARVRNGPVQGGAWAQIFALVPCATLGRVVRSSAWRAWLFISAFLVLLLLGRPVLAAVPVIDRPVVDVAGFIAESDREAIEAELTTFRKESGVQIAVLVVHSTDGPPIEDYSLEVAKQWGGGSAERDDGVLFVLAIDDRRMRLEVGYGLEPALPDATAARILELAKPSLEERRYADAIRAVTTAVMARTRNGVGAEPPPEPASVGWALVFFFLMDALALSLLRAWRLEDKESLIMASAPALAACFSLVDRLTLLEFLRYAGIALALQGLWPALALRGADAYGERAGRRALVGTPTGSRVESGWSKMLGVFALTSIAWFAAGALAWVVLDALELVQVFATTRPWAAACGVHATLSLVSAAYFVDKRVTVIPPPAPEPPRPSTAELSTEAPPPVRPSVSVASETYSSSGYSPTYASSDSPSYDYAESASSSSSSSDWSGSGGSFGGGGASSSW